ncbi:hypothetical protein F2P81_021177 [Scophthalmus maximus]|uniref:Uncharacterized protein n=1 Tax=Scophthalmus maximus TaxID=52904 RepID=A0A6A4S477_SCOMX|nr:hypothetical protein F2P81_021177 [Scophthalmus maximus]
MLVIQEVLRRASLDISSLSACPDFRDGTAEAAELSNTNGRSELHHSPFLNLQLLLNISVVHVFRIKASHVSQDLHKLQFLRTTCRSHKEALENILNTRSNVRSSGAERVRETKGNRSVAIEERRCPVHIIERHLGFVSALDSRSTVRESF